MTGMDIGQAVDAMRHGRAVAREGWNGKGMFLFIANEGGTLAEHEVDGHIIEAEQQDFVMMRTAQNTWVPWLCSQSDLLARDWVLAEF